MTERHRISLSIQPLHLSAKSQIRQHSTVIHQRTVDACFKRHPIEYFKPLQHRGALVIYQQTHLLFHICWTKINF